MSLFSTVLLYNSAMSACILMMCVVQFVETPEFNPEAVSFLYVPVDFDHGKNHSPMMRDMPAEFP